MGDGGFRVDVNVSVHKLNRYQSVLLPACRVELKNLNSFNAILKATDYEINRQKKLILSGQANLIRMETRTFDSARNKTISMRSKEDQYDYRFMPEPNLLPLIVFPERSFKHYYNKTTRVHTCENNSNYLLDCWLLSKIKKIKNHPESFVSLDKVKDELSEKVLPQKRRDRLVKANYGLTQEKAFVFVANDLDIILHELIKIDCSEIFIKVNDVNNIDDAFDVKRD
jgi:Asp-tRNA(Asn)/Glu-tRNA(Gln) amidotransferase B subunit